MCGGSRQGQRREEVFFLFAFLSLARTLCKILFLLNATICVRRKRGDAVRWTAKKGAAGFIFFVSSSATGGWSIAIFFVLDFFLGGLWTLAHKFFLFPELRLRPQPSKNFSRSSLKSLCAPTSAPWSSWRSASRSRSPRSPPLRKVRVFFRNRNSWKDPSGPSFLSSPLMPPLTRLGPIFPRKTTQDNLLSVYC